MNVKSDLVELAVVGLAKLDNRLIGIVEEFTDLLVVTVFERLGQQLERGLELNQCSQDLGLIGHNDVPPDIE